MFLTNVYYNFNMNYNCAITKQLYATLRRIRMGITKRMQLEELEKEDERRTYEDDLAPVNSQRLKTLLERAAFYKKVLGTPEP